MKRCMLIVLFLSFILFCNSFVFAKTNVEFIVDCSNSMNDQINGEKKIDLAKSAFYKMIDEWQVGGPGETNIGLRLYGFIYDKDKPSEDNCMVSQLILPIQGADKDLLKQRVASAQAQGLTPIAYSLEQAVKDFQGKELDNNGIILISDGQETCGGDPVEAAKNLLEAGFKVVTHVVGFGVTPTQEEQLKEIAVAGGGKYYKAEDATQLSDSLKDAVKQVDREKKEFGMSEMQGEKLEPGNNIESAPLAKPGKYVGDIYSGEKLFYKIEMGKNQTLNARVELRHAKDRVPAYRFSMYCYIYNQDYEKMANAFFAMANNTPVKVERIVFQVPPKMKSMFPSEKVEVYFSLEAGGNSSKTADKMEYNLELNLQ